MRVAAPKRRGAAVHDVVKASEGKDPWSYLDAPDEEHPRVVHCKRSKYDVLIDRTTRWGNPFVIGRDGNRLEVISKYGEWLDTQPELLALLPTLRGKILGCHCSPDPCHGSRAGLPGSGA